MQVLFSLKPKFADLVLSGRKKVEVRNRAVHLKPDTRVWIYATRPRSRVVAVANLANVVVDDPESIWRRFGNELCLDRSEYIEYTRGRVRASAIVLGEVNQVAEWLTLDVLRDRVGGFQPPQFYSRVASDSTLSELLSASAVAT